MSAANHMLGRGFWERICLFQILQPKENLIRTNLHFTFSSQWNIQFHFLTLLYWACEFVEFVELPGLNNWTFSGSLHLYNKLSAPICVHNTPVLVRNGNNIDAFHGQSHFWLSKVQSNNVAVNRSNNSKVSSANGATVKAKTIGSYFSYTALFVNMCVIITCMKQVSSLH